MIISKLVIEHGTYIGIDRYRARVKLTNITVEILLVKTCGQQTFDTFDMAWGMVGGLAYG